MDVAITGATGLIGTALADALDADGHRVVRVVRGTASRATDVVWDPYAGTIDEDLGDNSDGAVEITDWRAHGAIASASFVAVDAADRPVAASLVTGAANGSVWIGYVFTDPGWKGQGLGTAVVAASLEIIAESQVFAGVTDGNTPSERLLTSLGFVRTGPV